MPGLAGGVRQVDATGQRPAVDSIHLKLQGRASPVDLIGPRRGSDRQQQNHRHASHRASRVRVGFILTDRKVSEHRRTPQNLAGLELR